MEIIAANWEDWIFLIIGIFGILGALTGFLYSTIGRIYGFYKPFNWQGGGKSTFWGEMAVYTFILVWGFGFSGIIGQTWIYFLPFAIISWIVGFIDQHRANKRARLEGYEEEDPIENFGEELDRLENKERIAKGFDPIPEVDPAGTNTAHEGGRYDTAARILKWAFMSPLVISGTCIVAFFLGKILGWEDHTTDLFGMLMGISVFVFMFLFFGVPGFFGVFIMFSAIRSYFFDKQKTRIAFLRLVLGGVISVGFSYCAVMFALIIQKASQELIGHLTK